MHAHTHKFSTGSEEHFFFNLLMMNQIDLFVLHKVISRACDAGLELNEDEAAGLERFKQSVDGMVIASKPTDTKPGVPVGVVPAEIKTVVGVVDNEK